jgi:hypothetical protein
MSRKEMFLLLFLLGCLGLYFEVLDLAYQDLENQHSTTAVSQAGRRVE